MRDRCAQTSKHAYLKALNRGRPEHAKINKKSIYNWTDGTLDRLPRRHNLEIVAAEAGMMLGAFLDLLNEPARRDAHLKFLTADALQAPQPEKLQGVQHLLNGRKPRPWVGLHDSLGRTTETGAEFSGVEWLYKVLVDGKVARLERLEMAYSTGLVRLVPVDEERPGDTNGKPAPEG